MRHATTGEVLRPLLELAARRDRQREVIEPDAELGQLTVVAGFMGDEPKSKARGWLDQVDHPRRNTWRGVLRVLDHSLHAENLLIPGGASIRIAHGQLHVRDTGEVRHGPYPQKILCSSGRTDVRLWMTRIGLNVGPPPSFVSLAPRLFGVRSQRVMDLCGIRGDSAPRRIGVRCRQ